MWNCVFLQIPRKLESARARPSAFDSALGIGALAVAVLARFYEGMHDYKTEYLYKYSVL